MFDSLQLRIPCPSLSPRVWANSCPLGQWWYLTTSSSATPFSFAFNFSKNQGLFQWVSSLHQVTKVLELYSFCASYSNEYPRLISFRIHWFDLLEVQGTLKSLLQHDSLKASIIRCSSSLWFNSHIHTWLLEKPQVWLTWTFVRKVISLLYNMLSRFVITFLPKASIF